MGGVYNAINMDVYHYAGSNPVKLVDPDGNQSLNPLDLGFTNPFSFMMEILKSNYEVHYNEGRNQTTSTSLGFATGFIKGFFGPDFSKLIERCGKDLPEFYVEEFKAAVDSGEITGQIAGLLNFTTGVYQSGKEGFKLGYDLGESTLKGILKDPKLMKEFLLGVGKGLTPSVKPTKFSSLAEGAGYFVGQWFYNRNMNNFNNEMNK